MTACSASASIPASRSIKRAALLPTGSCNILWECLSLVTDDGVSRIRSLGGVDIIAISHPHFYSSMVEWSEALGGVPILVHEADREWIARQDGHVEPWTGDRYEVAPGVSLTRCGGHFPGSAALHWRNSARPGGALFTGDAAQVAFDRRHTSFLYSYPNMIPMSRADVAGMRERLADLEFDDIYGFTWGRNIVGGARAALDHSFERYLGVFDRD